jgi:hypothetical protein
VSRLDAVPPEVVTFLEQAAEDVLLALGGLVLSRIAQRKGIGISDAAVAAIEAEADALEDQRFGPRGSP